jgi:hypothetical protein
VQGKKQERCKNLAHCGVEMYRKEPQGQLSFEDFYLPFGGHLNGENRWIELASQVPWDEFEEEYAQGFSRNGMGAPAKPFRMALGAELIKRKLDITDEEVVEQLRENPYLQYFVGMEGYRNEAPFDASMMTHFRERLNLDLLGRVNERVIENQNKKKEPKRTWRNGEEGEDKNLGKLLLDASCIPQDIRYPTDLSLLNEAREKTERMIDLLHEACGKRGRKPRTYRKKARKEYLKVAKQRKKGKKLIRRGIKGQLGYVRRNLKTIAKQGENAVLSKREQRNLDVCRKVYEQQEMMYRKKEHRVDQRIVSISQPHVRPIVRGKAGAEVEFGSKLLISVVDGHTRIERLGWENYNEGTLLQTSVEAYKKRYGYYPESVHVDTIFRTRDNRQYCKERHIRISGPALGRPSSDPEKSREALKQEIQDSRDRIPVEGKFGNCKRKYGLNRIYAKKQNTSECEIAIGILLLNLDRPRGGIIFVLFCTGKFTEINRRNCRHNGFYGQKMPA